MSYDSEPEVPDQVQAAMGFKMVDNCKKFVQDLIEEHDLIEPAARNIAEDVFDRKMDDYNYQNKLAYDLVQNFKNNADFQDLVAEIVIKKMSKYR